MKNNFLLLTILFFSLQFSVNAQQPGDTIKVQLYTYDNPDRSIDATLPSEDLEVEKIILKYNMRCKNALVSTGQDRNKGCGEWDYSCNTYVIDSSKVEAVESSVKSHYITEFSGDTYDYSNTPTRNYLQVEEIETELNLTGIENSAISGSNDLDNNSVFQTGKPGSKSMYIVLASELSALNAGEISGMRLEIGDEASNLDFLRIRIAETDRSELGNNLEFDNFQEVYFRSTDLNESGIQDFNFSEPFTWDGNSNLVVETSFDNRLNPTSEPTTIKGYDSNTSRGVTSSPQREMTLYNNYHIEANEYSGIHGDQDRTMEAWIKTDEISDGELISWGSDRRGEKWVWRLNSDGQLRLEINGGGTVGTTNLVDGQWHHIACVLEGNNLKNIKFFIDGVEDPLSSVGDLKINTADAINLRISKGVNNRYHKGLIDEVRVWNVALSEEEIHNWMRMNITDQHPQYDHLQLEYKFDEDNGINIIDNSGNENSATYYGKPIRTSYDNGTTLFKEFNSTQMLPMIELFQGDYAINNTKNTTLKEINKATNYVIERSIIPGNPDRPYSDEIVENDPALYYKISGNIYDKDGNVIDTEENDVDGTINITDLTYNRRWPIYTELLSFVTPYGINLNLGEDGETWYFDMTDFSPVLRGDKHFLMTLGGQNQEEMDVELWYIVGTPPRDVLAFDQVWQATARTGAARINDILDGKRFKEATVEVPTEAEYFKVRSTITGHGAQGEFSQNGGQVTHFLEINEEYYDWTITQECAFNPIYPQGGTWIFDRQGWCPGEVSHTQILDVTDIRDGDTYTFNYTTSNPSQPDGDYRYHESHQLISYGAYNFQNDGRINAIVSPSDWSVYKRRNPVCEDPVILFENTGKNSINSISIDYWVNDGEKTTYTWTGEEILPSEEREITLPNNSIYKELEEEDNTFSVEITGVNGGSDEYSNNNKMSSVFEATKEFPNDFYLEIRTNLAAYETSYKLYDADNNIIKSNNLEQSNTTYRDTFRLGGCYRLEITDTGHDGLRFFANNDGTGSATFYGMRRQILQYFNPDFGGGITYYFTAPTISSTIEDDLQGVKLFPNPATDKLIVTGTELKKYDIHIIDSYGKNVELNYSISDAQMTVDVSSLIPGMYIVQFNGENGVHGKKFVIQ